TELYPLSLHDALPICENADGDTLARWRSCQCEIDLGPFAPSDPVALHLLDRLGPVNQLQVVHQPLGIRGDAQHPLPQRHPHDRRSEEHTSELQSLAYL